MGSWRTRFTGVLLVVGVACTLLALAMLPSRAGVEAQDLPPRPATPTPTPQPTVRPPGKAKADAGPVGATIELQVIFPDRRAADEWQLLWTVVQWQDARGRWHDVEGWRGRLDRMQGGVGVKRWWLGEDLFGRGPFRWLVGPVAEGPPQAWSESFTLPAAEGETVTVEVLLAR